MNLFLSDGKAKIWGTAKDPKHASVKHDGGGVMTVSGTGPLSFTDDLMHASTSPKEPMLKEPMSPCTGYQLQLASSSRH